MVTFLLINMSLKGITFLLIFSLLSSLLLFNRIVLCEANCVLHASGMSRRAPAMAASVWRCRSQVTWKWRENMGQMMPSWVRPLPVSVAQNLPNGRATTGPGAPGCCFPMCGLSRVVLPQLTRSPLRSCVQEAGCPWPRYPESCVRLCSWSLCFQSRSFRAGTGTYGVSSSDSFSKFVYILRFLTFWSWTFPNMHESRETGIMNPPVSITWFQGCLVLSFFFF